MTAPFSIPFANCRTVFVDGIQTDHLREALLRYPGQRLADDTFPAVLSSTSAGQILDGCVFAVGPEMPGEALVTDSEYSRVANGISATSHPLSTVGRSS